MSKRILLADDSATAKTSVEQALGTADYEIITAGDGRSAMEQISAIHPHLVMAHAMLPEVDGYEVCRQVKETPDTSHIPVLLLTGTFEPFDINRAKEVRYDGFVTKPLDGPEVLALVARCIDNAVYPAADPVPEEMPEAPQALEGAEETTDAVAVSGSNAMLDRIFPEDPGDDAFPGDAAESTTESAVEDLFAIVESAEPAADGSGEGEPLFPSPAAEPDPAEATDSMADTDPVQHNAGAETGREEDSDVEAVADDEKTGGAHEDSDLSWFLRKYEEKQQSADSESEKPAAEPPVSTEDAEAAATTEPALTVADPFGSGTDEEAPDDTGSGEQADEDPDSGTVTVEPLPADLETQVTDQAAPAVELDDQQLEKISRRVVELLSESVVRDVAWEAVPEIAERLIRERIREIEAETETSN